MAEIFEEKLNIKSSDKAKILGEIVRKMEYATRKHTKELGVDTVKLAKEGILWVICWTSINIKRVPALDEELMIKSWPGETKFGMLSRRYGFFDDKGDCIINTSSTFTLMDENTREKVATTPDEIKQLPEVHLDGEAALPKMTMKFPENISNFSYHTVNDNEIDINGHVNNAFYIDWIAEILGDTFWENNEPKSIWVQYLKEIRLGDEVKLSFAIENNSLYGIGSVNDNKCFSIMINF